MDYHQPREISSQRCERLSSCDYAIAVIVRPGDNVDRLDRVQGKRGPHGE